MKLRILTIAAASALALAACGNNAEDEAAMTETDAATDATMADGTASSATDAGSNASATTSGGGSGGGAAAAGGSTGGASGAAGAPVMEDRATTNPNSLRNTSNEQVPGGPVAPGTPPTLPPGQIASSNPQ